MRKVDLKLNTYYKYAELTQYLKDVEENYPELASLESIGKSWEGRDIWAMTLTNTATGCPSDKAAIYVDGNIHAGEVTAAMVALATIDRLVSQFGYDEEVTHLMNTKTFYILPRVNPDGAEKYLTTPHQLRSSVRPYPEEGIADLPGLHPDDVDGDGKILWMRVHDDHKGEWRISAKDKRIMLPRRPGERKGPFYRIYKEGFINQFDGEPFAYHRTPWGLDLNRNFPSNWSNENKSGGTYPTAEPEVKAIVDFILAHKNIGALNCLHTTGGFYYRNPYTYKDEEMDQDDLRSTIEIAREGFYNTGYSDIKSNNRSTLTEWAYEHLGMIGYTTELWNRQSRAGLTREMLADAQTVEAKEAIELKLLEWNDRELCGRGFIDWKPFDHPQLGQVEIGGWEYKFCSQNPPHQLLEQECHKNALWMLAHASALPEVAIGEVTTEKQKEGLYKLTVQCENHGYLPTYITNKGKAIGAVKPDSLHLEGEGFTVFAGKPKAEIDFLEGYMNGQQSRYLSFGDAAKSVKKCVFIIDAPELPCTINLKLKSQRGGTVTKTITIE